MINTQILVDLKFPPPKFFIKIIHILDLYCEDFKDIVVHIAKQIKNDPLSFLDTHSKYLNMIKNDQKQIEEIKIQQQQILENMKQSQKETEILKSKYINFEKEKADFQKEKAQMKEKLAQFKNQINNLNLDKLSGI